MRNLIPITSLIAPRPLRRRAFLSPVVLAAAFWAIQLLAAQTPVPAPTHPAVHKHKHPAAVHATTPSATPSTAQQTPQSPPMPQWPVNEKPAQASVTWDSQGLRIDAANSSLMQILSDVSTATGTKVDGLSADQRIFGAYGPGLARDVLSQLLQGSGYNVLMIGDQGQGAPRQILLTARRAGGAMQTANNNASSSPAADDDADTEEPPQPIQPPMRPGFAPGAPPRSPQQIMQEMQQRQQQMQQMQQPPNPQ